MEKTAIHALNEFGQSVWLDNISRSMIESGHLKKLIELGLRGMTSNPTIFHKAISGSEDYDCVITPLAKQGKLTFEIYDNVTIKDIQEAADILRPIFEETNGLDGYISLEVNPRLAHKTRETIDEGRRLARKVNRPNVMFKVPSTKEGFPAIEELIASGINVNVTLIFSVEQYLNTAKAYLRGIQRLQEKKEDISRVRSVASVFASRIDTAVDKRLEQLISKEKDAEKAARLKALLGKAAVANCNLIYREFVAISSSEEFNELASHGAHLQRVLWGSTSTKNPAYSDIKYVSELIAKNTVNTMPEPTFNAFLDHGEVKEALTAEAAEAEATIAALKAVGIDIDEVCAQLLKDGVDAFVTSFEALIEAIEGKKDSLCLP